MKYIYKRPLSGSFPAIDPADIQRRHTMVSVREIGPRKRAEYIRAGSRIYISKAFSFDRMLSLHAGYINAEGVTCCSCGAILGAKHSRVSALFRFLSSRIDRSTGQLSPEALEALQNHTTVQRMAMTLHCERIYSGMQ